MEQRNTNSEADSGNSSLALQLLNIIEWFSQNKNIAPFKKKKKKLIAFPHSVHEVRMPTCVIIAIHLH